MEIEQIIEKVTKAVMISLEKSDKAIDVDTAQKCGSNCKCNAVSSNNVKKLSEEKYQLSKSEEISNSDKEINVAGTIEHSMLNPDISESRIKQACQEALDCQLANICVSPYFVQLASECLMNSNVNVCTVVGFPHGAASTAAKLTETREALKNGAKELDVAMNILAVKSGKFEDTLKDLKDIVDVARGRAKVKAIYEQSLFTDEEKKVVLKIAKAAGVDYIKISNALSGKKACSEDVRFVRSIIGNEIGIKIDGGISNANQIYELVNAGANRFGCSKSVQIVASANQK